MATAGEHMRRLALPGFEAAVAAHEEQGCRFRPGAVERAFDAAVRSLKADEEFCGEPEEE